jgi:hypothetical protein
MTARWALTILAAVTLVGVGSTAANAALPFDPSPFCRPSVGTPYIKVAPKYQGNSHYTVTVEVSVTMTCNGSINTSLVGPLLHYNLDGGADHIISGTNMTCTSSCTAFAHVAHNFECFDVINATYSGQITGFWKRTASGAKNTLTGFGSALHETWFDGDGVCP